MHTNIYYVEKNIHGAWVINGVIGIRQYYYYPKTTAIKKYIEEVNKTIIKEVKKYEA